MSIQIRRYLSPPLLIYIHKLIKLWCVLKLTANDNLHRTAAKNDWHEREREWMRVWNKNAFWEWRTRMPANEMTIIARSLWTNYSSLTRRKCTVSNVWSIYKTINWQLPTLYIFNVAYDQLDCNCSGASIQTLVDVYIKRLLMFV